MNLIDRKKWGASNDKSVAGNLEEVELMLDAAHSAIDTNMYSYVAAFNSGKYKPLQPIPINIFVTSIVNLVRAFLRIADFTYIPRGCLQSLLGYTHTFSPIGWGSQITQMEVVAENWI